MSTAKKSLLVLLAAGLVIVAAAPHFSRTRPAVRCGLPDRDYQFREFSQPERSLSRDAVLLPAPVTAVAEAAGVNPALATSRARRERTIKSFQFVEKPTLRIDHCSVSQMSVLLHQSGTWSVSLRADQNPLDPGISEPHVTTIEPARLFTDDLQRNEFIVGVLCYASHGAGRADGLLGKPLIIPLNIGPFWVQKELPRQVFVTGCDPRIEDYFDLIDRVEIEFSYRKD